MRLRRFIGAFLASVLARSDADANQLKRQEWRTLTDIQKASYIAAVKCLQDLPAQTNILPVNLKSRFDDFQAVHSARADQVHQVGHFLPWHRYLLHTYEKALREECGYDGAQPYWDWTLDVGNPLHDSPVFDPTTGFGGNGIDIPGYLGQFDNMTNVPQWDPDLVTGGGCITDGPFVSYNLSVGPGTLNINRCIHRAFHVGMSDYVTQAMVDSCTRLENYFEFWIELEGGPIITPNMSIHGGGHFIVGGEMADKYSSPGDPLFYLHHSNLDRIWWIWQQADSVNRLYDISGRATPDTPEINVTLAFPLDVATLAPQVPIRDVMDISGELLRYEYV